MSNSLEKKITQELEQSLRDVHLKKNFEIIFVICIDKQFPQVFFKKTIPKNRTSSSTILQNSQENTCARVSF